MRKQQEGASGPEETEEYESMIEAAGSEHRARRDKKEKKGKKKKKDRSSSPEPESDRNRQRG